MVWDTDIARKAGYESGDFIPLLFQGVNALETTTSSTYSGIARNAFAWERLQWDVYFPDSVQTQVQLACNLNPAGDQADVRLWNNVDNEVLLEQTGVTSQQNIVLGPTDYTPTTTEGISAYLIQIRNSDNATTIELRDPHVAFGIRL